MKAFARNLAVFLLVLAASPLLAGDNRPFDRAQRALKLKDYPSAITICLGLLDAAPADYDVNFLLAQAYARSGDRPAAMAHLEKMDALFPGNADVLLFMARIHTWNGDYGRALSLYQKVLASAPANEEALIGTADVAARRKDHAQAQAILRRVLDGNPRSAEAYYHLGLDYQWQGNRGQARANFEKAVELVPENEDYGVFLTRATPRLRGGFELRYGHEVEAWNDGRSDFQNDRVALHFDLPRDTGVMIFKYNQTHRFDDTDRQFGLEAYPRLWSKAYGRFELNFAPKSDAYARSSWLAEIYQGLFTSVEVSAGFQRLNFPDRPVDVYLGSLGCYLGNYYPYVRLNYSRENGNASFSWVLNTRRYFSDENYIYLGYGRGRNLLEDPAVQDLMTERGDIYAAGVVWTIARRVRLEFHFSRIAEPGLARNAFQVTTGYRFR